VGALPEGKAQVTFDELRFLWRSDLRRYGGASGGRALLSALVNEPSFKYSFVMRLCAYLRQGEPRPVMRPLYIMARLMLRRYQRLYGIYIPPTTAIGSGFYIGHYGGIVVHEQSTIGRNCNLSQGVTLGQANRGAKRGYPRVGDNVYIGPGAKIVGSVQVGDNVAIGANCVVTEDAPDNAVVVGVPGRVISNDGSAGYVNFTDYA
jgi:serine O-acetyltransferase